VRPRSLFRYPEQPRHRGERRTSGDRLREPMRLATILTAVVGVVLTTAGVAATVLAVEQPDRLVSIVTLGSGANEPPDDAGRGPGTPTTGSVDATEQASAKPTSTSTPHEVRSTRASRSKSRPTAGKSPTRKASPTPKQTSKPKAKPTKDSKLPSPVRLADGRPNFQLPFTCGDRWKGTTYVGHNPEDKKIDFFAVDGPTRGAPVRASAPGVVNRILPEIGAVKLYHGNRWYSMYNHMDPILVKVGQKVEQGQIIGRVGSVDTHVAHLHYEQIYDSDNDNWGSSPYEIVYPIIQGVKYSLHAGDEPVIRSENAC